jgi:hypothetical protein
MLSVFKQKAPTANFSSPSSSELQSSDSGRCGSKKKFAEGDIEHTAKLYSASCTPLYADAFCFPFFRGKYNTH